MLRSNVDSRRAEASCAGRLIKQALQCEIQFADLRLPDNLQRRICMTADGGNDLQVKRIDLAGEERNALTGDAGLVERTLPPFVAQHVCVIAAYVGQQRGNHIQRTSLVIATPYAGLDGRPFHIVLFKEGQSDQNGRFQEGVGVARVQQGNLHTMRLYHRLPKRGNVFPTGEFAVDAKAFTVIEQMRTHEGAGLADGRQAGLQETAGRSLTAGACHMDQLGRMAVGPERAHRLTQQLKPRQLGVDHSAW